MNNHLANITTTWDSARKTLTVRGEADGVSSVKVFAGFAPNVYEFEGTNELVLTDLPHGTQEFLYLRAVGVDASGNEYVSGELFTAIKLKHPILGIVKNCDEDKNIIDFIEIKKGKKVERFKSGERIVKISTHDVRFFVDGKLYEHRQVCAGQPMARPDDPDLPAGCDLVFWAEEYEYPTANKLKVVFNPMNGKENATVEYVEAGEKVKRPPTPKSPNGKEDCPFHGWYQLTE